MKQVNEDDSTAREPYITEEIAKLVSTSSEDWKGVILLGAYTGLCLSDCAKIKARNIDLECKLIRIIPRKTDSKKKVIEIPLHSELITYFKDNPPPAFAANDVFTTLAKVSTGGRKGLAARFKDIMIDAGVDPNVTRRTDDGAAREICTRSFHSLRHSFVSMLANANVSEEIRSKMAGHTESTTHQIYTHMELETMREGVDRIPKLGT